MDRGSNKGPGFFTRIYHGAINYIARHSPVYEKSQKDLGAALVARNTAIEQSAQTQTERDQLRKDYSISRADATKATTELSTTRQALESTRADLDTIAQGYANAVANGEAYRDFAIREHIEANQARQEKGYATTELKRVLDLNKKVNGLLEELCIEEGIKGLVLSRVERTIEGTKAVDPSNLIAHQRHTLNQLRRQFEKTLDAMFGIKVIRKIAVLVTDGHGVVNYQSPMVSGMCRYRLDKNKVYLPQMGINFSREDKQGIEINGRYFEAKVHPIPLGRDETTYLVTLSKKKPPKEAKRTQEDHETVLKRVGHTIAEAIRYVSGRRKSQTSQGETPDEETPRAPQVD